MYIDTPYWYVWYVMWQYVWIDHMPLCPTSHILRWVTEVGLNDVLDSVVEERPCGTTVSSPGDTHWYVYTYRYIYLYIYRYNINYYLHIYISLYTSLHVTVLLLYRVIFFRDPVMFVCAWDETQKPGWETWGVIFPTLIDAGHSAAIAGHCLGPAADCARFPRPQCFAGNSSA